MMPRLLALLLLALPGAAMADPITIFATVLSATGSAAAAGVIATIYSYGAYILVAANYIYGGMDARRRARNQAGDARRAYNAGLQDRNTSALQADPAWRVVYGQCRTGGDIVAIFTSDKAGIRTDGSAYTSPDGYKHLVVVVAAHEVDDITEMYIDGVAVGALDGSRWATTGGMAATRTTSLEVVIAAGGTYTFPATPTVLSAGVSDPGTYDSGPSFSAATYTVAGSAVTNTSAFAASFSVTCVLTTGTVRWDKHLGTTSQTVDSYLTALVPAAWTANDRLRGLAYVVVTLDLENQRWQGGPPQMAWDVRGRKVYDPRTTLTAWSANPALCVRDYLLSPWGFEVAAADIDDSYTIAAANACDVSITFESVDAGGSPSSTSGATYTCNGALFSSDSRERALNDLCDSMGGYAVYGARWQIVVGAWTAPVMALTDDDLAGQIEVVQAGVSLDEVFNGVRGGYVAADAGVPSDFTYANSTFVAADGRELWTEVSLPWTNSAPRARNLARVMVEANRDSQVIRFPASLRAWPLQVGDRVTVTSAEYGFTAKAYRVTDWAFGLQTPVMLTLQEDAAGVYDQADAAVIDPAPNTDLPNPWVVAPVSLLSASSGTTRLQLAADGSITARVLLEWSAITGAYVADGSGHIEVQWRRLGYDEPNTWRHVTVPGDARSAWIVGANDRDVVTAGVTVVNGLGARSDTRYLTHAVVGKTQPPAVVAGLTATAITGGVQISWTAGTDLDHRETEIRVGGANWAGATLLFKGKASAYLWPWPALGTYTLRAKHRDTSGNESTTDATLSISVTSAVLIDWATDVDGRPADADILNLQGAYTAGIAWNFSGSVDAWDDLNNCTLTAGQASMTVVATGGDTHFRSPAISISGAAYTKVRARLRRVAGSYASWDGTCFFSSVADTVYGSAGAKNIANPCVNLNEWVVAEWDMAALDGGGTGWTSNTITSIRLDLGNTAGDIYEIDWIAIGTTAPGSYGAEFGINIVGQASTGDIADSAVTATVTYADAAGVLICPAC